LPIRTTTAFFKSTLVAMISKNSNSRLEQIMNECLCPPHCGGQTWLIDIRSLNRVPHGVSTGMLFKPLNQPGG
jgi:hypothetical protein